MKEQIKQKLSNADKRVLELNEEYDNASDFIRKQCLDLNLQYWRGRADALRDILETEV